MKRRVRTTRYILPERAEMRRLSGPAKVITVKSRKGGSTKSTTSLNLAVVLSLWGFKVALLEVDDNPYLYRALVKSGREMRPNRARTTYSLFQGKTTFIPSMLSFDLGAALDSVPSLSKARIEEARTRFSWERPTVMSFLPGTTDLQSVEDLLNNELNNNPRFLINLQFHQSLQPHIEEWDFVIIDSPPQYTHINTNTTFASDHIIIPVPLRSVTTIEDVEATLARFQEELALIQAVKNHPHQPKELGVIYQMYTERINREPSIAHQLYLEFTGKSSDAQETIDLPELGRIPLDTTELILRAELRRLPVVVYAPFSSLAQQYLVFASNVLKALNIAAPTISLIGETIDV